MRNCLLVSLPCLAAVLTGTYLAWPWESAGINRTGFRQLQVGMTQEEVVRILGAPPGSHHDGMFEFTGAHEDLGGFSSPGKEVSDLNWWGEGGWIIALFDEQGRLVSAHFMGMRPASDSLLAQLRRWLRF